MSFTDKTKPLRVNVIGLDDGVRQVWKSVSSIQVPNEEDLEFEIKVSEECAIPRENCEVVSDEFKKVQIPCGIKDPKIGKEKAREKCHELCNQYKEYPVYFLHKDKFDRGKCLFSKDPKMFEYVDKDWHYGLCPTTTENYPLMIQMMPLILNRIIELNQDIDEKYGKINAVYQEGYKSNVAFGSTSMVTIVVMSIAFGSIGLFLYKRRNSNLTSNEMIGKK